MSITQRNIPQPAQTLTMRVIIKMSITQAAQHQESCWGAILSAQQGFQFGLLSSYQIL